MPSIHVIYDPLDKVRHPRAEELRDLKVSHITMALSEPLSADEAAVTAVDLTRQLLAKVTRK